MTEPSWLEVVVPLLTMINPEVEGSRVGSVPLVTTGAVPEVAELASVLGTVTEYEHSMAPVPVGAAATTLRPWAVVEAGSAPAVAVTSAPPPTAAAARASEAMVLVA